MSQQIRCTEIISSWTVPDHSRTQVIFSDHRASSFLNKTILKRIVSFPKQIVDPDYFPVPRINKIARGTSLEQ